MLVLERRYLVGGACVTEETFPGFKVSTAAYVNSLFRKEIVRDLRLGRARLRGARRATLRRSRRYPDGRSLMLGPDPALNQREIAKFSTRDAARYPGVRGHARAGRRPRRADAHHDAAGPAAARRSRGLLPAASRPRAVVPAGSGRRRSEAVEVLTGAARDRSRPLVRVDRAQDPRWPPTPSSARWRARRCRAPPTCSSTT